jgi:hypothetical protein
VWLPLTVPQFWCTMATLVYVSRASGPFRPTTAPVTSQVFAPTVGRSGKPRGGCSALTAGEASFRVSMSHQQTSLLSNKEPVQRKFYHLLTTAGDSHSRDRHCPADMAEQCDAFAWRTPSMADL